MTAGLYCYLQYALRIAARSKLLVPSDDVELSRCCSTHLFLAVRSEVCICSRVVSESGNFERAHVESKHLVDDIPIIAIDQYPTKTDYCHPTWLRELSERDFFVPPKLPGP